MYLKLPPICTRCLNVAINDSARPSALHSGLTPWGTEGLILPVRTILE